METEQEDILWKVVRILEKLEIPYFITGGIAVTVWGRPRFTADIDIVVNLLPQKLNFLAAELLSIDKYVYIDKDAMQDALERKGEFNFIDSTTGVKVDFWVMKDDPFSKEQMQRKVGKKFNETQVYFASAEDLILSKLNWYKETHSDKQMEDIESVLKIQTDLDYDYLRQQAKAQSTFEFLEPLLSK